ncbi:hypothetical protein ACFPJ1_06215 [Kribbella qitaiheensis]|uniref:hypothetical protein n=1 Tax=Kribbella qitaiheensis TaxID=1544730 RepID=UPI00360966F9
MNPSNRLLRLTAQISLLIALLGVSAFLVLRVYLDDEENVYDNGAVTEVVGPGPATIGLVEWKLDSLQPYTKLVDDNNKPIDLDQPAGSVVIVATASLTPKDGLKMDSDGFTCEAKLRDDRGNLWKSQSAYGFPLPTYCDDDDHPFTRNKAGKLAQVYVVPESAVPHLTGLQVENLKERRRILLTR